MRSLSETLLAAQKQPAAVPYVKVFARNRVNGVVRLDWTRLYTGNEELCPHAVTIPSDGSLVRVGTTPAAQTRAMYCQRVAAPGPGSDFSQWSYTGQYNIIAGLPPRSAQR